MIKFLSQAAILSIIYGGIKFLLSIYLVRLINPDEFANYAIIMIFLSILEVLLERGILSKTIKIGLNFYRFKLKIFEFAICILVSISFFIIFKFILISTSDYHFNENYSIVVLALNTSLLVKLISLLVEANLIYLNKYVECQHFEIMTSVLAYFCAYIFVIYFDVSGLRALIFVSVASPFLYLIIMYFRNYEILKKLNEIDTAEAVEKKFSFYVLLQTVFDNLSNKSDEIVILLSTNSVIYGNYSKMKELVFAISGFGSRVINRPWYYAIGKYESDDVLKLYKVGLYFFIAVTLFALSLPSNLYTQISLFIFGEKWLLLAKFSKYIIVYSILHFVVDFLRHTISSYGGQRFLTKLNIYTSITKILLMFLILKINTEYGFDSIIEVVLISDFVIKFIIIILHINKISGVFKSPNISSKFDYNQ